MLAELDELKESLGISPSEVDATRDALLTSSLMQANALISGYLGIDLSDTDTEHVFVTTVENANYIKLPLFPVIEATISANGTPMLAADFYLRNRLGMIEFNNGWYNSYCCERFAHRLTVVYRAGYEAEDMPKELKVVCLNIAAAIYNMGGSFGNAATGGGGTGALKSLTMFDAMSMSFDVGSSSSSTAVDTSTPEGMITQWAFMLKKHRVNSPVMA